MVKGKRRPTADDAIIRISPAVSLDHYILVPGLFITIHAWINIERISQIRKLVSRKLNRDGRKSPKQCQTQKAFALVHRKLGYQR